MKIKLFLLLALLVVLLISACSGDAAEETNASLATVEALREPANSDASASDASSPPADADLALQFTMTSLDGEEVALASLRGRYVLVNFWATWCGPCRDEMPYLEQLSIDHADQLTVLGVNMNEEPERIYPFVEEFGLTFPVLLDPPDELIMENNVRGLPVSYVVGPDGTVVYRKIGEILPKQFDPWLAENLKSG